VNPAGHCSLLSSRSASCEAHRSPHAANADARNRTRNGSCRLAMQVRNQSSGPGFDGPARGWGRLEGPGPPLQSPSRLCHARAEYAREFEATGLVEDISASLARRHRHVASTALSCTAGPNGEISVTRVDFSQQGCPSGRARGVMSAGWRARHQAMTLHPAGIGARTSRQRTHRPPAPARRDPDRVGVEARACECCAAGERLLRGAAVVSAAGRIASAGTRPSSVVGTSTGMT
jgi:hypothetical protein